MHNWIYPSGAQLWRWKKIGTFESSLFFQVNRMEWPIMDEGLPVSECLRRPRGRVIFQLRKFSSIRRFVQWVSPMRRLPAEIYRMA